MTIAVSMAAPSIGWLRNAQFDLNFIVGTTMLAIGTGAVVINEPRLFAPILLLDLWLLGQHHVVSTFTRLCFTIEDRAQYRFLLYGLPPIVLAFTLGAAMTAGIWIVGTVYFYWQWFHYIRQSWGINQAYLRSAEPTGESEGAAKLAFYLPPLWGILHRSWQAPELFLGMSFKTLPVSGILVDLVGLCAIGALCWWCVCRYRTWRRGGNVFAHTLYITSHHTIFFIGYLLVDDVTYGWLVLNIWHNAQYILFVWLMNNRRYSDGVDRSALGWSTLCQSSNLWRYLLVCFGIATVFYVGLRGVDTAAVSFGVVGLPVLLLLYQTINFHHYIVDAVIWRRRAHS
ncbi:MAG: hypothetical protein GKS01_06820 [Alphaproteobacteria bacterium]|nr:hypothetical protein [Alphaproteobacteria bacterium]